MARTFTDTLRDLRAGSLVDEASERLASLVSAVAETGKPGKLLLELTIKRTSRSAGAITVTDRLTVKRPEEPGSETLMFSTPEGSLVASDPRQSKLDLKVAAQPPATLRVASQEER